MLLPDKEQYKIDVYNAFSGSELVIASVIPEEDYIEAVCTKCGKIEIYRYSEIGRVRCSACHKKRMKSRFEKVASKKAESAGFSVTYLSFEEDYIEVECLSCDYRTSARFKSLDSLCCPYCTVKKLSARYSVEVCFYDEDDPDAFDMEEDEVTLLCQECGEYSWKRKISDLHINSDSAMFRCNLCYARENIEQYGFVEDCPKYDSEFDAKKYPITCRRCGSIQYLDLNDSALEQIIRMLKCTDNCKSDGIRERTESGAIVWCRDELDLFAVYDLTRIEKYVDIELDIPNTIDRDIYIGYDTSTNDYCHVFVVFNGNYDEWNSKYLFFSMEAHLFKPDTKLDVEVIRHWPHYYKDLLENIEHQFEQRISTVPDRKYNALMNAYLGMISAFMVASDSITRSLVEIVELRRKLNEKLAHKGITKIIDPWFAIFKEQYHCPVCQYPHRRMAQICTVCGFDALQKKFATEEDAKEWEIRTLNPLRKKYLRMQNRWFLEDGI